MKTNPIPFQRIIHRVQARCFLAISLLKEPSLDAQVELTDDLNKTIANPIYLLLWITETICYVIRKSAF